VGTGERAALAVILLIAGGIRLAWIRLLPLKPESDFATFYWMAQKIAGGHWLPESYGWSRQGVGYPLLLALPLIGGGGLPAVRVTNVLLQIATVVGVWFLARRLFGPTAAIAGAALAAILPGLWIYAPLVAVENVTMLLLTVLAIALCAPRRRGTALVLGALAAGLAVARPAYLPFAPLTVIAAIDGNRRSSLSRLGWYVIGFCLVLGPIAVANLRHDGPVLPLGASGEELWIVNNDRSTGAWLPAATADDYPFKDLTGDAEAMSAAQRKLALQFVAANPTQAARNLALHHRMNWSHDEMGTFWTVQRAPADMRDRLPLDDAFPGLANHVYGAVLLLAAIGAVRHGRRTELLLPLILPLAYTVATLAVAEGNDRYHAPSLALLCVLAGASLASAKSLVWLIPAVGIGYWLGPALNANIWLILVVVFVPLVLQTVDLLAHEMNRLSAFAHRRPRVAASTAMLALAAPLLMVAGLVVVADRLVAEIAAVEPEGWQRYHVNAEGEPESLPLILESSGTTRGLREVSYPAAAALPFAGTPSPGEVVGLERTLSGLRVGANYRFYLQVYDPGPGADPTETLTVRLNDRVVWQRGPSEAEAAGWHYISVPWVADGSALTIRVERQVGSVPADSVRARPLVRSLHLYPKY
jgi:hypothetical protein